MKKILNSLIGVFLLIFNLNSDEIQITWDAEDNPSETLISFKVYISTNGFPNINANVIVIPYPSTTAVVSVESGPLYSIYVTAVSTNGLESIPSNQIRYQKLLAQVGRTNFLTLHGASNWVGAKIIANPTNGILSGTPPNLVYYPINTILQVKDTLDYELSELWQETNIVNYYTIKFLYDNTPPKITE
jgi:hypothetical protein